MHDFRLVSLYKNAVTINNAPLLQLFNLIKHIPSYNIRQPEIWKIPTVRTSYGHQSILHTLPVLLNNLAKQNITPETSTKQSLKSHFIFY